MLQTCNYHHKTYYLWSNCELCEKSQGNYSCRRRYNYECWETMTNIDDIVRKHLHTLDDIIVDDFIDNLNKDYVDVTISTAELRSLLTIARKYHNNRCCNMVSSIKDKYHKCLIHRQSQFNYNGRKDLALERKIDKLNKWENIRQSRFNYNVISD